MPVTNIRRMSNGTDWPLSVHNREHPGDDKDLPAHYTIDNIAMWIPWCDSENDFDAGHYIEVVHRAGSTYIMQSAGHIYYAQRRPVTANWHKMTRDSFEGRDKVLAISTMNSGHDSIQIYNLQP